MTDDELIAWVRNGFGNVAADRIEALVKERDVSNEIGRAFEEDAGQQRARAERLEAALREFAAQKTTGEMTVDEYADAAFDDAYDTFIIKSRAALKGADHE